MQPCRIDTAQRSLNLQTSELDNLLKKREFDDNIKMEMYRETKDAIGKDPKTLEATLLIINEMLKDDSAFKWKLKSILSQSPFAKNQPFVQERINTFTIEQNSISKEPAIDVFYLDEILNEALPRANKIVQTLKEHFPKYNIRLRLLPSSINSQSGYRIQENMIRYNKAEASVANKIQTIITNEKIFQLEQPRLKMVGNKRPNYIGVFVRNM